MSTTQQRLLILAAALAAIQFLWLPLMDYQAQQHDELKLLQQRLGRSQELVTHEEELREAAAKARANEALLLEAIPVANERTAYRIELQGEIQNIVRTEQLNLEEFNWLTDAQNVSQNVQLQRAKIRLEGPVSQLAKVHLELTQKLPSIRFVDVSLTPAPSRNRAAATVEPQMRLELLMEIATRSASGSGSKP